MVRILRIIHYGIDGKKRRLLHATEYDRDYCLAKFAELEDKIESGELCDREEVRKQTAKEILKELLFSVENCKKEDILWYIESISKRYGVELFGKTEQVGNPDKLEDEV